MAFRLETFVDFPDDALTCCFPITRRHVEGFMDTCKSEGISRVIWGYYGDGHGGFFMPAGIAGIVDDPSIGFDQNQWTSYSRTQDALENPLRVACEAAHRRGIEVYAYFKPYETGPSIVFPEGSPQAREWGRLFHIGGYMSWIEPFVVNNPHLRIARRRDDLWPGHETATIATIKLTKKDDSPTRIKKENLQIWTSDLNWRYRRKPVEFQLTETVEPSPREVRDVYGNVITRAGAPTRVLTLSGLSLDDRYIMVTTDFADGPGDFSNAWDRLLTAYDARGREIPGVYATGTAIWFPEWEDFREGGMVFDTGRGPELVTLDLPNNPHGGADAAMQSNKYHLPGQKKVQGCIAYARGRNAYLPAALCETEPQVQQFWLKCIGEMLDAGVDGIEFRVENHSTHTDTPHDYGFNDVVMRQVRGKGELPSEVAAIRGRAYTDFLRQAKSMIAARKKKMRVNLNVDWFRPAEERPGSRKLAFSANIDFDWRGWIDAGLLDEAMLRIFAKPFDGIFGEDRTAREMIETCAARKIPLTVNRYVWGAEKLVQEFDRVVSDGRFSGFVFYEAWSYMHLTEDGRWIFTSGKQDPASKELQSIWQQRVTNVNLIRQVITKYEAL